MIKEKQIKNRYFEAVGRRKTSTARVRLSSTESAKNVMLVNTRDVKDYFPTTELRNIVNAPFETVGDAKYKFGVTVIVHGGGIHSQAEAVRHGVSRALIGFDLELRKILKKAKMLKRDPRSKERRKFGLKKARKAPQWSKR
ncbi:MAG: 30S ribosomal protein S9 [Candidatus Vogelbacteria bacterium]|nr:30S ribosomal protein S9 [Candidatus Vogelbacteria bacterium]